MTLSRIQNRVLISVVLFLLILLSRLLLISNLEFHIDEIWSIWSAEGSINDTLARVPFDWPPLYALFMWFWRSLMGIHPYVMRLSSVFLAMLSYAIFFRVAKALFKQETVAWLAVLAYAGFGFSITLSLFVRGYAFMMPVFSLALWFTIRYFRHFKVWDAIGLAFMMAALFYTNLTAITSFAAIGLFSLVIAPKQIWRWWLPSIIALALALPEVLNKIGLATGREAGSPFIQPTLFTSLEALYTDLLGDFWWLWLALIGVALLGFIIYDRQHLWSGLIFLVWGLVLAIILYFLDNILGFFTPRQMWWILPGIGFFLAFCLQKLPKPILISIGILTTFLMFISPVEPLSPHPFEEFMPELVQHIEAGDAVLLDPHCNCGEPMRWEYYQQVLFPNGLNFVDEVSSQRRIWYISRDGRQDETITASIQEGRIATKFFGPPNFFFRLYQAPPDTNGLLFDNGMRFHGVEVLDNQTSSQSPILRHEGENLHLRLWWSVDNPLPADYSISIQILGKNGLIVQSDSAPQLVQLDPTNPNVPPHETSRWQSGQYYIEERDLFIPNPTLSGEYTLYLIVYQWWDGVRISASQTNQDNMLELFRFNVMSW